MKIKKILSMIVLTLGLILIVNNKNIYAANLNGSVSSVTATQGEEVSVNFTLKSDANMGVIAYMVYYDSNILEYVSGGSSESTAGAVAFYNADGVGMEKTYTITFKAKGVGTSELTISEISSCTEDGEDFVSSFTSGSVTVNAPVIASSNNNLASLEVTAVKADGTTTVATLSPAFSKDVTQYNISLGSGYVKLVLSAVAEDPKATISTWGTPMDPGANTTGIEVRAEDGSKKSYVLYTQIEVEETTTTTEPEQNTEFVAKREIMIDSVKYLLIDMNEETALPQGFELTSVMYNDEILNGATDIGKELKLILVKNVETEELKFFIYDEEEKTTLPFVQYDITARLYILLPVGDDFLYEGVQAIENTNLQLESLNMSGGSVDAYLIKNTQDIYIVRAMNWNSEIGYYYYNKSEGSMFPVFSNGEANQDEEVNATVSDELVIARKELENQHDAFEKRISKRNMLIYGMGAVIIIMLVVIILSKMKKDNNTEEDDDEDAYEEEDDDDDIEENTEETVNEDAANEGDEKPDNDNEKDSETDKNDNELADEKEKKESKEEAVEVFQSSDAISSDLTDLDVEKNTKEAPEENDTKEDTVNIEKQETGEEFFVDISDVIEDVKKEESVEKKLLDETGPLDLEEFDKAVDDIIGKLYK